MKKKIAYLIKHVPIIQCLYVAVIGNVFKFMRLFIKTDEKLILFSSYGGSQYSDSPKVLYEAICKDIRFTGFRFVWAFEKPNDYTLSDADIVKIDSLKYFFTALKAKIWITNVNIERGLHFKSDNTIYLNTWHGTGPKKGGNAVKGRSDYDFSYVDILCIDGTYMERIMKKYFKAREEAFIWCGRPREDALFEYTEEKITDIRKSLNIPIGKKVILYMPTWRDMCSVRLLDYELWASELGCEYVVLIRNHHFTDDTTTTENNIFINVTSYPDVNDLYMVSDILISDYSSAFFDFGLLNKPIICYAYDYDDYLKTYGLFIDLKREFPNGIKNTEKEVLNFIKTMNYEDECENTKRFCHKYVEGHGKATLECLNKLYELLLSE